ncbi:MAG: response regulator [Pseudomonadota bacterium]
MAHILLMEDDEPLAEVIAELIARHAHTVETCTCATEARDLLSKQQFDLLITDILVYQANRPVPDGGISLITWLRGPTSHLRDNWMRELPIIAISGAGHRAGMPDVLSVSKDLGADIIIQKPAQPGELLQAISDLTAR